jgi:hypothetical protein
MARMASVMITMTAATPLEFNFHRDENQPAHDTGRHRHPQRDDVKECAPFAYRNVCAISALPHRP